MTTGREEKPHRAKHQLWANMGTCHLHAGRFAEGIRLETHMVVLTGEEIDAGMSRDAGGFAALPTRRIGLKYEND